MATVDLRHGILHYRQSGSGPAGYERLGLPADFLVAADGHVLACKYGVHAYDQWSVDDLLQLAGHHIQPTDHRLGT
jgi:hypothetical protein